jgi:hypothetical protein
MNHPLYQTTKGEVLNKITHTKTGQRAERRLKYRIKQRTEPGDAVAELTNTICDKFGILPDLWELYCLWERAEKELDRISAKKTWPTTENGENKNYPSYTTRRTRRTVKENHSRTRILRQQPRRTCKQSPQRHHPAVAGSGLRSCHAH